MTRVPLSTASVIAEAADLADEIGFDAVTLSAVARRLGVQTPSLYSHVRDLAALRDGVTSLALQDLADRIAASVAGRSAGQALRGFAEAHRELATQSPGRWQSLQRRAGAAAVESGAARVLVRVTDSALQAYALSPIDQVHAVRLIGSTINGFLNLERVGSFDHSDPPPEESWTVAITALDAVLAGWPRPTERPQREPHA